MRENINKVSQRGERLDSLQDKTDNLAVSAQGFRRGANRVRKQMWWKDMKMRVCIIVGIIILLIVIIVPAGKSKCCKMSDLANVLKLSLREDEAYERSRPLPRFLEYSELYIEPKRSSLKPRFHFAGCAFTRQEARVHKDLTCPGWSLCDE